MLSIAVTQFGGPEVLREIEGPDLVPGPGEVSIDVEYAAVGLVDVWFRRGDLADAPGDLAHRPPFVPGLEVAGTVRGLGEGVTGFTIGQPVVTLTRIGLGGYATIAIANADLVFPLDFSDGQRVDPVQAVASLPNATTAILSLTTIAHMAAGESVLVHGAAGGLASVYPAVAKALGASTVLGTVGTASKRQVALELGYDEILTTDGFVRELGDRRVDIVIDPVGGPARNASLAVMATLGRLVAVGHASAVPDQPIPANDLWFANHAVLGLNAGAFLQERGPQARQAAKRALELIADRTLRVPVEVLPLSQAAEAHHRMEARTVSGRLILTTRS